MGVKYIKSTNPQKNGILWKLKNGKVYAQFSPSFTWELSHAWSEKDFYDWIESGRALPCNADGSPLSNVINPGDKLTSYPDNNPKTGAGLKKPPVHLVPPSSILAEAEAFKLGAAKYGPYNWREKKVSASIYYAAALRHLQAWWDGQDNDEESGATHLGHAKACLGILIDGKSIDMLNDDRPTPGAAARIIKESTEK